MSFFYATLKASVFQTFPPFLAKPPAIAKVVPELLVTYHMVTVSELFKGVSLTPGQLYTHRE